MLPTNVVIHVPAGKVEKGTDGSVGKGRWEVGKGYRKRGSFLNAIIWGIFSILGLGWLLLFYLTSKYGGLSLELPVLSSYLPSSSDLIHTQDSECHLYADEPQMCLLTHKSNCYQTPHMNDGLPHPCPNLLHSHLS